MSGTLTGVKSLGSEATLYGKMDKLPEMARNLSFLANLRRKRTHYQLSAAVRRKINLIACLI